MTEIQRICPLSPVFADRFVRELPGFVQSEEYQRLDEQDRTIPGLVFAAVAGYVENSTTEEALAIATEILEDAIGHNNDHLNNDIVTEVFEHWHNAHPPIRAHIQRFLGPLSRRLWDRWMNIVVPQA